MADLTVNIEKTQRRKIILSRIIEHRLPEVHDLDEEKFASVTDSEIEWFVTTMSHEEKNWTSRRYQKVYFKNVSDAIKRLHPPVQPTYGRTAGAILDNIQPHEYGNSQK